MKSFIVNGKRTNNHCFKMSLVANNRNTINEDDDQEYYKLTNLTEVHNGVTFTTGLNVDPLESKFDQFKNKKCGPGGFYFCKKSEIYRWMLYSNAKGHFNLMMWMRKVTIPHGSKVQLELDKIKATRIILGPRKAIPEQYYIKASCFTPHILNIIPTSRAKEMCMVAVTINPKVISSIQLSRFNAPEIHEIILAAVNSPHRLSCMALNQIDPKYITPELYSAITKRHSVSKYMLQFRCYHIENKLDS